VIHRHPDFASSIEALVGELEQGTDAEIVVVAATRSGSYRDVALLAGAAVAVLALLFLLYSPLDFHPLSVPIYLLGLAGLASWLVQRSPAALRLLTRARRRRRQAEQAARACFVEEAVHGTRRRVGLLVYLSELEQQVVLLRDLGLDGAIPAAAWNSLQLQPGSLAELEALLRSVGTILADKLPSTGDKNEIPNAPRVRS